MRLLDCGTGGEDPPTSNKRGGLGDKRDATRIRFHKGSQRFFCLACKVLEGERGRAWKKKKNGRRPSEKIKEAGV